MGKPGHIVFSLMILLLPFMASGKEFYFIHYDITNGLSQNTVHKILQDHTGFMWFATKDGLNRFDGRNFRRIDTEDGKHNNTFISTIFEDSSGKIWVGTNGGPCIYDPYTEKLSRFDKTTSDGKSINSSINDFQEDRDGKIYISVDNDGVFVFDKETGTLDRILSIRNVGIPSVTRLCFSPSGRIYFGTFGNGLYYSDNNLKSIHPVCNSEGYPAFENSVINCIKREGDKLYIATDNQGLHSLDINTGYSTSIFVTDEAGNIPYIRDFCFNDGYQLIIGSENGLYIYNLRKRVLERHLIHDYFDKYSISDNAIYSVMTDRDGDLWIGSYFGGVDFEDFSKPEFVKFQRSVKSGSIPAERIREICQGYGDRLVVGSEDNGISLFNPYSREFSNLDGINAKNIHGLAMDGENLWVGTFADGLFIKNLRTGHTQHLRKGNAPDGFDSDFIFSIFRTNDGTIYLGTLEGLIQYDRGASCFLKIKELDGLFIYNINEDTQGNVWVATYSDGLFLKKKGSPVWINFVEDPSDPKSLPSNKVYSIQQDSYSRIWIMTQNGPCVYEPSENLFDRNYLNIGNITGVVYRMEQDEAGRYWLTSNNGLYCIEPMTGKMKNFTVKDGLPTNQFNYNSSYRDAEGNIYFGSIDGMVCFNPTYMHVDDDPGKNIKPVVSELFINSNLVKPQSEGSPLDVSVTLTDELRLKPWQNNFAMNLSSLNYDEGSGRKIRYRLKGFEENWKYLSFGDGPVSYSNLSPGNYILQAEVFSDSGIPVGERLDLPVIIETPFYQTWWAIVIMCLIVSGILCLVYIYYRRYARLSNERYIENYKHNKERELFDSKIKFFTNVAHEIRTPLTLIKAPLDTVFKSEAADNPEIKENLEVVNMNVDRLLQLADQLLDFRKIESGNYTITRRECDIKSLVENILVRFMPTIEASRKTLEVFLPEDKIMAAVDNEAVTKIISNLITNAIKYSRNYIRINLKKDDGEVVFRIANDGEIIKPEEKEKIFSLFTRLDNYAPGTGIGLAFSRSLAGMHGGSLVLEDNPNENIFVLRLPFGEVDTENDRLNAESDLEKIVKSSGDNEKVLIVEDNPELLSFLQKRLIANNYKVLTASSGEDALKILGEQHIDIVVSDLMMPGMDGRELLRHIKEDIRYSHIPFILLTAKTNMSDKLESLEAGADSYIEKPFSMEYLLVSIDSLLRNRDRVRHKIETIPLEKISEKVLTKADEEFLKKINEIITKNFSNPDFSVDDIIVEMGLGSTTFYRKVKGLLNLNPNQYIKLQRLKRAAQLFKEGHTSVSEVCYLVGFSSPGYFTKCFQQQFGIPPKDYIKGKI